MPYRNGLNLGLTAVYYSADLPTVDQAVLMTPWQVNSPTSPTAKDAIDEKGQPTGRTKDLVTCAFPLSGKAESFDVIVTGDVAAVWSNQANGGLTFNPATGAWQAKMAAANYGLIGLVPKGTGPVNVTHICRTEQRPLLDKGVFWNPDFTNFLHGYKRIRFMDPNCANEAANPNIPLRMGQPWLNNRMPVEAQTKLCNDVGADMAFNIHHTDTPDQQRAKLSVIAQTLDPARDVMVEFSNEVWNFGFPATHVGMATPGGVDDWLGYQSGLLARAAAAISKRFKVPLFTQWVAPDRLPRILAGWDRSGAPRSLIGAVGGAPYVWIEDEPAMIQAKAEAGDVAWFIARLAAQQAKYTHLHGVWAKAAAGLGVPYIAYERNQSMYPDVSDPKRLAVQQAVFEKVAHSEEVAAIIMKDIAESAAAGMTEGYIYNSSGPGGRSGFWGIRANSVDPLYPLGRMLAEMNARDTAPPPKPKRPTIASTNLRIDALEAKYAALASVVEGLGRAR